MKKGLLSLFIILTIVSFSVTGNAQNIKKQEVKNSTENCEVSLEKQNCNLIRASDSSDLTAKKESSTSSERKIKVSEIKKTNSKVKKNNCLTNKNLIVENKSCGKK